jgi:deoxycytidylate deaminase
MDVDGYQLSSGYNGPASGEQHCIERPCGAASMQSGTGLDLCEAIHAETNALMRCPNVRAIRTCYVTASPCLACVKSLMNTACERIVFAEAYAHDDAACERWLGSSVNREWVLLRSNFAIVPQDLELCAKDLVNQFLFSGSKNGECDYLIKDLAPFFYSKLEELPR